MVLLNVKGLTKNYGNRFHQQQVLKGLDFAIEKGEFVSIMGPSGSGKTTLLNVLSSIDYITSGTVEINGHELSKMKNKELAAFRKSEVGFIFQDYSVLNTLTVKENIMLPLSIKKLSKEEMTQSFNEITEALGIYDIRDKYPSEISGGQQQRTAAARAFVHKPAIIFADEPTGALDSKSAQDLLFRLEEMNKQFNATIVMVTHDPVAASYSNRVIMLKDGNIHSELYQGDDNNKEFYRNIIYMQATLGGVVNDI
ncbi:ABC transporter ATP-binding protein [Staphylococcus arlettae]|uniref:Putative hemin import ATP-binding protein HrtA n=1 Tax=Staphylococcus arlettae TaxID=29378 RepID=A0A380BZ26_9STAP|nr:MULTISPECIES: ABC transporter ATP-binding protein [Staphylococcus]PNZ53458.1 bacitracin ABC transporter ATP-binding protein [Staphylococcus arlettae]GEQ01178.1 ABC transporter ATP-binding protein [Staphylococcus arlettae]SUJ09924.1 ABC transporter ATPase [Staphylococcus arlettae]